MSEVEGLGLQYKALVADLKVTMKSSQSLLSVSHLLIKDERSTHALDMTWLFIFSADED